MKKILNEIAEVTAGQGAPQGDENYSIDGTPFIKAGNLYDLINGESIDSIQKVNDDIASKYRLKKFPAGTVVFAKSGMSCLKGYVYVMPTEAYVVNHLACIVPDLGLSEYLKFYFMQHKPSELIKDSSYPSIRLSDISDIVINLPELSECMNIVKILNNTERVIKIKKLQLLEFNQLIKSRFVEMFGDPKTNSKRLPLAKPEEICESISAGGDRPNEVSSIRTEEFLYPIFSNGEKDDGLYGWSKGFRIEKPAITISGRGTIGYASFKKDGKFTPIVRLIVMIPNEKVNPIYLTYYMNLEREIGSGSGVQQLTVPMIKGKSIIIPEIVNQNEFALFVEHVDKLKFVVQQSLDETQKLFDSLMQKYFG